MSDALQVKTVIDPHAVDTLLNLKLDIFSSLNCVKVGLIKSFDGTRRTAEVQILFKRKLMDGTIQSYPQIIDLPVFTLQGGGGSLQFPIAAGDQCIVLFADRRLDEWFQSGQEAVPGDARMHDLSDGIALVGLNALNSALPIYPSNKVVLAYQDTMLELKSDGWTLIGNGGAEIDVSDTIDLTADAGAEIELDALVSIKNNATTLLACLSDLITTLQSLTVQVSGSTGVVSAATIAALTVVQNEIATLLE